MRISDFTPKDALKGNQHRKDNYFTDAYIALDLATGNELFECRIYKTNSRAYACLWVFSPNYASGSAFAGGYGYCKESTAIQSAFLQAGIKTSKNFAGTGQHMQALEALAEFLTKNKFKIIHAHA